MVSEVIALDKPYPVLTEIKTVAFIVQKTTSTDETTETVEAQCADVPGFVVGTWMTAYGADGKLKSKTTVQLLNYEVASEVMMPATTPNKTGIFRNKRQQRKRKRRPRRASKILPTRTALEDNFRLGRKGERIRTL